VRGCSARSASPLVQHEAPNDALRASLCVVYLTMRTTRMMRRRRPMPLVTIMRWGVPRVVES
jgi:hypothetical protein